jgi:mono/diheme cytochrome c family protein
MSQAVLGHHAGHTYSRTAEPTLRAVGMMVEFSRPDDVYAAAEQMRKAGFTRWDVHTPYPMHGLDRVMGVRFTLLPVIVFCGGVLGCLTGLFLTHYTAAFEIFQNLWLPTNLSGYALNSSGKPLLSTPAFIPPIFELTVLFSGITTVIAMLVMNNLPHLSNALLSNARFRQVTTDKFFVVVDANDPKFDLTSTAAFLRELGGSEPIRIEERVQSPAPPKWFLAAGVVATVIALIPLVVIAKARNSKSRLPRIHIVQDMDNQERFKGQMPNPAFLDGRAMRPEPAGTVARGDLRRTAADPHLTEGLVFKGETPEWATTFPPQMDVSLATLQRGQNRFGIYCAPCHGLDGRGNGPVNARNTEGRPGWETWVQPTSLHDQTVRDRAHGHIFNTITNGIRTMPPYGPAIPVEDRWAIVAYVRALQRSSAANLNDVPVDIRTELEARQP